MIEPRGTALKEGEDEHDAACTRHLSEVFRGGAGNGFGEAEGVRVFRLAEVEAVVELLKDDELGALSGASADGLREAGDVGLAVGCVMLLD